MTAQLASQASFESGTIVGGKYRIVSLIGIGGVGRVYLARHIELDTDVAIKVLKPEMGDRPDAVQRFSREARASVRLRSERIARVTDVGTHEGKPYFVMEYLIGCSLLETCQQANVDIPSLCEFFIQACEGLADAHAQGVVHRDIKPENLFVVRDSSGWRSLKLFDFGISKFSLTGKFSDVDLGAMRTEAMMGTPHYISPEQIRSTRDVDHRTDLWSLGAVMFEVLSGGVLPFREEREITTLVAEILERPHRSLRDVAPNVPERLVAIVDRCLEKDRELRYQSAAEVALDLLPLAPSRARASVERAVSVMQTAGLMPLNGDMESLRPILAPHSDRLSSPPRVASFTPPPLADAQAPHSETRPSASAIPLGTPPPMPARRSDAGTSGAARYERTLVVTAVAEPPVSVQPAASVQPVEVARRAALTKPVIAEFDERAKTRKRRVALLGVLGICGLLATAFWVSIHGEAPTTTRMPSSAVAAMPTLPTLPTLASPAAVPSVPPVPIASTAPLVAQSAQSAQRKTSPSAERKAAPTRVLWAPRPAAAPAAPKAIAPKSEVPPPPPPLVPQTKLELRRER